MFCRIRSGVAETQIYFLNLETKQYYFQHAKSNKFLKLVPKYRAQAKGCYQVVVDSKGSEDSYDDAAFRATHAMEKPNYRSYFENLKEVEGELLKDRTGTWYGTRAEQPWRSKSGFCS